ncbi:MAG: hypothetical protein ISS16_11505 [Ignavibacteria bacterium]|nr:hypothetical protein [Ignavibacteria bacterium]
MNISKIVVFIILSLTAFACSKNNTKYVAYYFHPTARCQSCLNLESYMKELIDTKYTSNRFQFKVVNIEEKENEHYTKDFDLQFSSVILVKFENDKQIKWNNLDSVWSYTNDKEKFFNYAEQEITDFMNN